MKRCFWKLNIGFNRWSREYTLLDYKDGVEIGFCPCDTLFATRFENSIEIQIEVDIMTHLLSIQRKDMSLCQLMSVFHLSCECRQGHFLMVCFFHSRIFTWVHSFNSVYSSICLFVFFFFKSETQFWKKSIWLLWSFWGHVKAILSLQNIPDQGDVQELFLNWKFINYIVNRVFFCFFWFIFCWFVCLFVFNIWKFLWRKLFWDHIKLYIICSLFSFLSVRIF